MFSVVAAVVFAVIVAAVVIAVIVATVVFDVVAAVLLPLLFCSDSMFRRRVQQSSQTSTSLACGS